MLTVFAAAADVCRRVDAAALQERNHFGAKLGELRETEPAKPVQHRGVCAVLLECLMTGNEDRNECAVL